MRPPATPPPFSASLQGIPGERFAPVFRAMADGSAWRATGGRYLHWDELRHRPPPDGLDHEQWWMALKWMRTGQRRELPFRGHDDRPFWYALADPVLEGLGFIDSQLAGQVVLSEEVANPATRDRYIVRSLIEEAITSSQLEGAVTTHRVAKEMLQSGRPPRTRDERMIQNNYDAMQFLRENGRAPLTPGLLLELHARITRGAIDPEDASGRFRRPDEHVSVRDLETGEIVHLPPPAESLPGRVADLCRFANGETPTGYLPPALRSVALHLWLAYDHPFVDGNGRTARALFYWEMLKHGYWLSEFISISGVLRKAPVQYARAFQLVETDGNDATYFLLHQIDVLRKSVDVLRAFLARKQQEVRETEAVLKSRLDLNHRQLALLAHALRHPEAQYSIASHQGSHRIAYDTARLDLEQLTREGFLARRQHGRRFAYEPSKRMSQRTSTGRARGKRASRPRTDKP